MEQQENIEACFEEGKNYFAQQRYEEALPCLEKVKSVAPNEFFTNLMLGFIYEGMERHEEAVAATRIFLNAADMDDKGNRPNVMMAFRTLGMASLQLGNVDESIKAFSAALELDNNSVWTLVGLGQAYLEAKDFEVAKNVLQQALAKDPESVMANYWMGKVPFMQQDWEKAETLFVRVTKLDSQNVEAYFHLAMCYMGMDQNLKAFEQVQHLERLGAEQRKENLFELFAFGAGIPVEEYRHAMSLGKESEEYTAALSRIALFLGAESRNAPTDLQALEYKKQGRKLLESEEYEMAAESFKKALELNDSDAEVYRSLGFSYSMCERYEDAVKAYGEAAKLKPTDVSTLNLLGVNLMRLDSRDDDAIHAFEQACAADPQNFHARNFLGNAHYCKGTPESLAKALEAHQRASEIESGNPEPYQSMAVTYIELGEKKKALEQAEKLRPLDDEQYSQVMKDIAAMPVDSSANDDEDEDDDDVSSALEVIDLLSDEFRENIRQQERNDRTRTIQLASDDRIVGQGERILGLYEDELAIYPGNRQIELAIARHLANMGYLYAESVSRMALHWDPYFSNFGDAECAQRACNYLLRSYGMFPASGTACLIANIFIKAEFFGTAIHWYGEAQKLAHNEEDSELELKLKAGILNFRSEGNSEDPLLSPDKKFPTRETAGLVLENQPETPLPPVALPTAPTDTVARQESVEQKQTKLDEEKRQLQLKTDEVARQKQLKAAEEQRLADERKKEQSKGQTWAKILKFCGLGVCAWLVIAGVQCMNQPRPAISQSSPSVSVSQPNTGLLTATDLDGKTKFQLDIMRNQIFARHGLKFGKSRKDLGRYFEKQSWYKPNTSDTDVVWARLSPAERKNVAFIRDYQIERGMMKP